MDARGSVLKRRTNGIEQTAISAIVFAQFSNRVVQRALIGSLARNIIYSFASSLPLQRGTSPPKIVGRMEQALQAACIARDRLPQLQAIILEVTPVCKYLLIVVIQT